MGSSRRYCLALDLKDDPKLIAEYEEYHRQVWPEVLQSIKAAGIEDMEIYRFGSRLFMIMEVDERFNFKEKAEMDASIKEVREWEKLMWKYQQAIPGARPGEKWVLMDRIFKLHSK